MLRNLVYGNVIADFSNNTSLGGTLTISNSCKTSSLNNRASIAFAVADISFGTLKKGLFNNNIDSADARITAIIDTVSPTVGTGLSLSVSSNHVNPPVEALRVQSNGNVGIGTQTPQFPLDVNGNIRLGTGTTGNIRFGTSGVGTTQAGYIDLVNNNMTVMNQQNGNIIFGTNNGEDMRILSNGNVGIGTQTPQFPLDVNGNIRLGTGTTGNIRFGTSGVGTTQSGYIDLINNNMTVMNQQNGNIIFGTNNGEDMRISSNGNVGIGTQTPQFPLDVNGNIRLGTGTTGNIRFGTSGVGTTQAGYIDLVNNNMTVMNQQNGNIIFGTNNGEDMRILSNGNVGIGTQTPQFPLDVNGIVRSTDVRIDNVNIHLGQSAGLTNQGTNAIAIGSNAGQTNQGPNSIAIGSNSSVTGTSSVAIGYNASTSTYNNSVALGIGATSTANNQIVLGTASQNVSVPGNVGIGTQTPQFTLDVNGDTRISGNCFVNGSTERLPYVVARGSTVVLANNVLKHIVTVPLPAGYICIVFNACNGDQNANPGVLITTSVKLPSNGFCDCAVLFSSAVNTNIRINYIAYAI